MDASLGSVVTEAPTCRYCFEPGHVSADDSGISHTSADAKAERGDEVEFSHVIGTTSGGARLGDIASGELELISPCDCSGSQRYVHLGCLRKWQCAQVTTAPASRARTRELADADADAIARHLRCSVCNAEFRGVARITKADMLEMLVGLGTVRSLQLHSILVASQRTSQMINLPNDSSDILVTFMALRLAHWKYGAYFIYKYDVDPDTGDGVIRALNLTRHMDGSTDKPIPDQMLLAQEEYGDWLRISHFNGGPVQWVAHRSAACVVNWDPTTTSPPSSLSPECVVAACPDRIGCWIVLGMFADVLEYLKQHHHLQSRSAYGSTDDGVIHVCTFSGYAQWTRHQLLGEIHKGKWGVLPPQHSMPVLRDACYSQGGNFVGDDPVVSSRSRSSSFRSSSSRDGGTMWGRQAAAATVAVRGLVSREVDGAGDRTATALEAQSSSSLGVPAADIPVAEVTVAEVSMPVSSLPSEASAVWRACQTLLLGLNL